jgi:hypothetical protein
VSGQYAERAGHRLGLDDEVTRAGTAIDRLAVVHQLDGDELVAGQLEHDQPLDRRLGHPADDLVADGGAERRRPIEIGHPQSGVQGSHAHLLVIGCRPAHRPPSRHRARWLRRPG